MHPHFYQRDLPAEGLQLVEHWSERPGTIVLRQPAAVGASALYFSPRWQLRMDSDGLLQGERCPVALDQVHALELPYRLAAAWKRQAGSTACGLAGYLAYDLGPRAVGCLHPRSAWRGIPELWLGLYDAVVCFGDGPPRLAVADLSPLHPSPRSLPELWEQRAAEFLAIAPREARRKPDPVELELPDAKWHNEAVYKIQDYLRRGHVYQVNLTAQVRARGGVAAWPLFAYEYERNPTEFAAFVRLDDAAITSFSPERLLRVKGGTLLTSPIKGTATLSDGASLRHSPKDRAEHVMIVDLSRNDLGRVSEYGSVRVLQLMRELRLRGLVHLVSDIQGRLRPGREVALLPSLFPGGSITGAPKRRAMEIISEVESSRRGVYTGSVGVVRADGSSDWSIAIRTAVWQDGEMRFGCGGGIVLDSDPEREYAEALLKAESFIQSLRACTPEAKAMST